MAKTPCTCCNQPTAPRDLVACRSCYETIDEANRLNLRKIDRLEKDLNNANLSGIDKDHEKKFLQIKYNTLLKLVEGLRKAKDDVYSEATAKTPRDLVDMTPYLFNCLNQALTVFFDEFEGAAETDSKRVPKVRSYELSR